MFSTLSHKRRHDDDDDVMSMHHDKRLRHSSGNNHGVFGSNPNIEAQSIPGAMDDSLASTITGTDSSDDMDMDMRDDFHMELSQSPEQPSSWIIPNAPLRNPRMALDDRGSRVPTPIALLSTRPKPTPLQGNTSASSSYNASTSMRARLAGPRERFPSPISEDEPHTPTTATGSQFSLLTVNDIDMDAETTPRPPPPQTPEIHVRKQRQRSGAFTSPRDQDTSKKFSMGYREDCDKCRNRVPGHMNHFLR
ncbi:hypothetical protein KCU85_g1898, partial [Aureobasidium melanogenum]